MPLYTPNYPLPTTWANRPAATIGAGVTIFVTDVGVDGSIWISNGTVWKPTSIINLHRLVTPVTGGNGTAEEALIVSNVIPAAVLSIGRVLQVKFLLSKSGTVESTTHVTKIGTNSNGLTGASALSGGVSFNGANRQWGNIQEFCITSATSSQQTGLISGSTNYGLGTATVVSKTISDISNPLYISLTDTKTTGGIETITVQSFELNLL